MRERLAVIVPTYNMSAFLPGLWASIERCGLARIAAEVIVVNDGSTDDTARVVAALQAEPGEFNARLKLVDLPVNGGRFRARHEGAIRAESSRILFLDSRLELPDDFGAALDRAASDHESLVGSVDIDVDRNIYCLYWDRSHRAIFRRHYAAAVNPIELTPENYNDYLKGTTVFLCARGLFLETCRMFEGSNVLNDDTLLMRHMVETTRIVISPDVRVRWVPREDAWGFLARLWERGPSFVEYHVFERRGGFFYVVVAGVAGVLGFVVVLASHPALGVGIFAGAVACAGLSTALFARSPKEFFLLAPLHIGSVAVFGAGIIRGLCLNLGRWASGRLPHEKLR